MRWIQVPIGSNRDGRKGLDGVIAECPDCGRREWWFFRLSSSERFYLQCLHCDRIEAADGKPTAVEQLEAYALAAAEDVVHPLTAPGKEVGS